MRRDEPGLILLLQAGIAVAAIADEEKPRQWRLPAPLFKPACRMIPEMASSWTGAVEMISLRLMFIVTTLYLIPSGVMAGVFSLSPFNGDWQESFESFPPYDGYGRYVPSGTWIMGGNATVFGSMIGIYNAAPPPNLAYFGTAGGQAQIEDGCQGLFAGFNGITISFNEPIRQFGGYFATNRFPGMVFEFFDVQSDLFDTEQLPRLLTGGTLTWYGWGFSKPVKFVRMQGDNLAMDFLQADLVAVTPVPEPQSLVSLSTMLCFILAVTLLQPRSP